MCTESPFVCIKVELHWFYTCTSDLLVVKVPLSRGKQTHNVLCSSGESEVWRSYSFRVRTEQNILTYLSFILTQSSVNWFLSKPWARWSHTDAIFTYSLNIFDCFTLDFLFSVSWEKMMSHKSQQHQSGIIHPAMHAWCFIASVMITYVINTDCMSN